MPIAREICITDLQQIGHAVVSLTVKEISLHVTSEVPQT